jgi:exo-beta-1,3-glucanase (GH17 family)
MNKNLIAIALGGVAVYYFFLRKKTATATMLPAASVVSNSLPKAIVKEQVIVSPVTQTKTFVYPFGLQEGDYVKFGTADPVYLLVNGQRRWISYDWMMANDRNYWDKVKFLESYQALSIPEGPMLTA